MVHSQHLKKDISIIRVIFEFPPGIGGSAIHTIELSKKINPHLKKQIIIAPNKGEKCKEFDEKFEVPIIRVKYYPIKKRFGIPVAPLVSLLYMINVYFKLKELRKLYKVDIIHTHGISTTAFGVIVGKLLNIPVVGIVDGSLEAYSKISGLYETIIAMILKPDYANVIDDGSIALKKFKKIWKERITILLHGIDVNTFKSKKKNKDLVKRLGLKESDFLILSTSSLIPVKNIDLAIKSIKILLLKTKARNIYFLISGEGILKNQLIDLAKKSFIKDNIKFLGGLKANVIPEYLSIADVVVATSLYSNLNLSVQEAMACEKPVVVFDSGGTGKLIKHMKNGLLVKPSHIEDFAEKLKLLYENPELRVKLGHNARETIVKERNWDTRIKKELQIYEKVLGERNEK